MYNVGVVGCGAIATHKFFPALQIIKDRVRLVGVCDLNKDLVSQVAQRLNVANAYTNVADMLSEKHPDILIVLTPPKVHADNVIAGLASGAHVLVEKPMATSVEDCDKMNIAAKQYDRKLGVMHSQLFHPPMDKVRKDVKDGRYGRFLGMRILLAVGHYEWIVQPNHWAHKLKGGVVGEAGPHATYLSLAFLDIVRKVQVFMAKHHPEDNWLIGDDIRYDLVADNGISSVYLDFGSNQTTAEVDIMCSEQLVRVDLQSRTLVTHNRPVSDLTAIGVGKSVLGEVFQRMGGLTSNMVQYYSSRKLDGHYVGIVKFLNYIEGKGDYPATGEDGRRTIAVLDQVVDQLEQLRITS